MDEPPPLLQHDIGGALEEIARVPVGDAGERPHGAGADGHAGDGRGGGTARDRAADGQVLRIPADQAVRELVGRADDDRVDPARLHQLGRLLRADQGVALLVHHIGPRHAARRIGEGARAAPTGVAERLGRRAVEEVRRVAQ